MWMEEGLEGVIEARAHDQANWEQGFVVCITDNIQTQLMPELRKLLYTTKYQSNIFEPYQSPQPTTKRQASSAPSSQNNRDKENE